MQAAPAEDFYKNFYDLNRNEKVRKIRQAETFPLDALFTGDFSASVTGSVGSAAINNVDASNSELNQMSIAFQ